MSEYKTTKFRPWSEELIALLSGDDPEIEASMREWNSHFKPSAFPPEDGPNCHWKRPEDTSKVIDYLEESNLTDISAIDF